MKRILCFLLIFIFVFSALFVCSCSSQTIPAEIDILKTGKADCIVINTGEHIVMIDTGEVENLPDIRSYMIKKGYEKIDTLILTHYDKDHIGCADIVISSYRVERVIESSAASSRKEYVNYHNTLSSTSTSLLKLTENFDFTYDDCRFHVDIPKKAEYKKHNDNNLSLIVSMKCGKTNLLFGADAMETRLEEFMSSQKTDYHFVKLPYHGNYLDNYESFLDFITPDYAAITCSKKNPPSEKTLSLLEKRGVSTFLTYNGIINVQTDGITVTVKQEK